ncbi:L-histidine N(alpha)-methyltransferase, partial [Acinetobacter baumannii]
PTTQLRIHRSATSESTQAFADDVRRGLSAHPKNLPPKYFYEPLGSQLFEAICLLPEYYLTRAEDEILAVHSEEIIGSLDILPE